MGRPPRTLKRRRKGYVEADAEGCLHRPTKVPLQGPLGDQSKGGQAQGVDYYLFPGGGGRLAANAVALEAQKPHRRGSR